MKNKIFHYLLTLILITVTVYILASSSEIGILPILSDMVNLTFLLGAVCCMFIYWLCDAFIIKTLFKSVDHEQSYFSSIKISMVGQYYNLITPFASGGQPAQILTMTNHYKLPLAVATSITISKFMIYHVLITLFPLIMFLLKPNFIWGQNVLSKTLIFTGIGVNTLGLLLIFGLCYNSKVVNKFVMLIIKILNRFNLAKNIDRSTIDRHVKEYKACLIHFLANKKILISVSGFCLVQVTAYFSVTYFVYLSLGLSQASLLDILAVQSLLYTAVNMVPTPGNVGASEGFFYLIFGIVFPAKMLVYAIILWRLVIYYFNLAVSGLFIFSDYALKRFRLHSRQGTPAK